MIGCWISYSCLGLGSWSAECPKPDTFVSISGGIYIGSAVINGTLVECPDGDYNKPCYEKLPLNTKPTQIMDVEYGYGGLACNYNTSGGGIVVINLPDFEKYNCNLIESTFTVYCTPKPEVNQ